MTRTSLDHHNCSFARTIDILGDRWSLMILRDAFYGVQRFSKFKERLGITQAVLSARLAHLVQQEILERKVNDDGGATQAYLLTPKGKALFPVMVSLMQWGDDWIHAGMGPPIILEDKASGATIDKLQVTLNGQAVALRNISFATGPGASDATQAAVANARSRG
jgi:DNA-binding HxlR family transcriptional regulator